MFNDNDPPQTPDEHAFPAEQATGVPPAAAK